jgi:hypothetical protein
MQTVNDSSIRTNSFDFTDVSLQLAISCNSLLTSILVSLITLCGPVSCWGILALTIVVHAAYLSSVSLKVNNKKKKIKANSKTVHDAIGGGAGQNGLEIFRAQETPQRFLTLDSSRRNGRV